MVRQNVNEQQRTSNATIELNYTQKCTGKMARGKRKTVVFRFSHFIRREKNYQNIHVHFFEFLISGKAKDKKRQWCHSFFSFRMQWELRNTKNEMRSVFRFSCMHAEWEKQFKMSFFVLLAPNEMRKRTNATNTDRFLFISFRAKCDTRNTVFTKRLLVS